MRMPPESEFKGPASLTQIAAVELQRLLLSQSPLALIDPREEADFATGHLLLACNLPLSRFEMGIEALVPRHSLPIVLVDAGDGSAGHAAEILAKIGYRDIRTLAGGLDGWREAGLPVFSGVFVPSKAFGEWIEATYDTPHITAAELFRSRAEGRPILVLDARPFEEFSGVAIPGALNCPASELPAALPQALPDDTTLVVVNCGGRTRSIIGAQVLRNLGLPNPVAALKDGTMGWHLAGFDVERGATSRLALSNPGEAGRRAARRLAETAGVQFIDHDRLRDFEADSGQTTLYRFDVRPPDRFRAGHRAKFLSAHGVQLVQATDTFIADRSARIVLTDDDGIAAPVTASWLRQMGFRLVFVLDVPHVAETVNVDRPAPPAPDWPAIGAADLQSRTDEPGLVILDLASSAEHRRGHVPGARFASRSDVSALGERLPAECRTIVLVSSDGRFARFAARDYAKVFGGEVLLLEGGTAAWQAASMPIEHGLHHPLDPPRDVFVKPFDRANDRERAMRDYIAWETGLLHRIDAQGLDFTTPPDLARPGSETIPFS